MARALWNPSTSPLALETGSVGVEDAIAGDDGCETIIVQRLRKLHTYDREGGGSDDSHTPVKGRRRARNALRKKEEREDHPVKMWEQEEEEEICQQPTRKKM